MGLMFVCSLFLFLLYLIMMPSDKSSDEMKTAYYILVVPEWLKSFSAYSFLGLLLLIPIYSISKSYKGGYIKISNEFIELSGGGNDKKIPIAAINKIMLNDVTRFRRPHEAMEILIFQKPNRKTSFLLKHYIQSEEFIHALVQLETVELSVTGGFALATHDDDDEN
jgi:hypothetical protein